MFIQNTSTLIERFTYFTHIIGGILRLDPQAIEAVLDEESYWIALAILLLGGISLGLGQSVILFANRVRRRRFALSLLLNGLVILAGVCLWAATTWLLVSLLFQVDISYWLFFSGAALSTAPFLFGFLVLIPYLGNLIFQILRIWILLINLVVIDTLSSAGFLWALGISLVGWLSIEFVLRFPAIQFDRLQSWYWRVTTGKSRRLDIDELVYRYLMDIRPITRQDEGSQRGG